MPKPYTLPTLYNDALTINITKLKRLGFFIDNKILKGDIQWSIDGKEIANISIEVNLFSEQPFVILNYSSGNTLRNYKVGLVAVNSNLGLGKVWYFVCPCTHKRCRNLYYIDGYFLHREAFNGAMYESQTESKNSRAFIKRYSGVFEIDKLKDQIHSKYFKTIYSGKQTKKYLKIRSKITSLKSTLYRNRNF